MNAREVGDLLAVCAAHDQRTTGDADVIAWTTALSDLSFRDCAQAVAAHYAESAEFIRPADVRQRVRVIRANRLDTTPLPDCPPEIARNPVAYLEWRRQAIRAIADGDPAERPQLPGIPPAIEAGGVT